MEERDPRSREDNTVGAYKPKPKLPVNRRQFLKGAGLTVASVGLASGAVAISESEDEKVTESGVLGPGAVQISMTLNGEKKSVAVEPSATLLDTVRGGLGLTGAKRVCDRGSCGACTMLVDGRTVNSCSLLAIDADGSEVRTIEGVTPAEGLSPIQAAFVECDALQCGFCTPGMIVACTALLERNPNPSEEEVRESLAGNLCRCGTYANIFEAVDRAAKSDSKPKREGGKSERL